MKISEEKLKQQIRVLIDVAINKAKLQEAFERQAGKILFDGPISRLIIPPTSEYLKNENFTGYKKEMITMQLHPETNPQPVNIITGATSYLTARRMWNAYHYALGLLKEENITNELFLYDLFHYVPGTATLVESKNHVLIGVRSQKLAGTHTGMISIPAGLMKPGELIRKSNMRELYEETGIKPSESADIVAVRHPDAPSFTFVCKMLSTQQNVSTTYEVKGKKFIWVEKDKCLFPAVIDGKIEPLIKEIRRQNIEVPDNIEIAPDILEGLKRIYQ